MSIVDDPAVSVCFAVTIDNSSYDLGLFTTCDGLGCEITVESRQEGGNNGFVYQLPGPMKYTNVKFTRPSTPTAPRWPAGSRIAARACNAAPQSSGR